MPFRAFPVIPRLCAFFVLFVLCDLGRPSAAHAADIEGVVLDPDGHPTPGAHLLLTRGTAIIATVTTDRQGRFTFTNLDDGRYRLRVARAGFKGDAVDLELAADAQHRVSIPLRVSAFSESIVVSASTVERPLSQVPDSVTVIGTNELRAHQIETVVDALRLVPGLSVTANGGRGAITSLFPRGGESDFTLVQIDGVQVNAFGGAYDFAHLPVTDIERIEVVRGPQSALWGSGAIGGVVHIVTRHGGPTRTRGVVEGGELGTFRAGLSTAGSYNRWSWGAGFEQLNTDGFTGTTPGTEKPVTNDDYLRRDGSVSGGWATRRTQIRGNIRLGTNERGVPGPYGADPGGTFAGVDTISRGANNTWLVSTDATHAWTPGLRQQFMLSYVRGNGKFLSPFGESFSTDRRLGFRTQLDATLGPSLDLSAGLDVQREQAESTFISDATFTPTPVRRFVAGYFAEIRTERADRLLVSAGLRVEQIRRDALAGVLSPFAPRPDLPNQSEYAVNPKVSVALFLQPPEDRRARWTRLRLSVGTGIRPPSAFEIAFTDNPALKTERSRSLDFGVEQALAGDALVLDVTAFFNRYDDLIISVGRSLKDASQFTTDNLANSRARGVEIAGVVRAGILEARVSYTWLDSKILAVDRLGVAPPPFQVGDALLRRPRHQGAVNMRVGLDRLTAYASIGARGQTLDIDPTLGAFGGLYKAPGYGVVNIGASAPVRSGVELFSRIDNLLDRRYEETLGFPALGRRAIGGLRIATR